MRTLLLGLIFFAPPLIKKALLRWFCQAEIGSDAHVSWFSAVMGSTVKLGTHSIIRPFTLIKLTGQINLGDYSEISSFNLIYGSSSLYVGNESYIGPQSLINVEEEVRVGQRSALGPRSMVFTHGSFLPFTEGYWVKMAGVSIGDNVWCASGVFIHPGVEIGDDTFINSRSVLTESVPAGSIVEGNPARVVYPMARLKRKMSSKRVDAALGQILRGFAEIGLRRELGLKNVEETEKHLQFRWQGRSYQITLISSNGNQTSKEPVVSDRKIFVLNCAGWSPPPGAMVFDLATMQTPYVSDPIHTILRDFMFRYYGIKFKDRGHI